ncbi:hypothetical protein OTU49_001831 [Cherax quadricarinatus]|uniref:Clip domain-containing protein n=1 Tax=Cherax quadricarinatus TaxID=27406 RepID=A0AAW0XDF5_CHEQU
MCFLVVTVLVVVASLGGSYAQRGAGCRGANSQQGTCGTIGDCPPLFGLLGQLRAGTAPPGALDTLRRAICGYERNFPLVCCTAPGAAGVTPAPGDSSKLPKRCGISGLTDKIIDGVDAPLLAWPWMALLRGKGGPLTLTNSDVSRHYVVGITSLGPRECGSSNTQGLYSSVSFYAQWILSNLQP